MLERAWRELFWLFVTRPLFLLFTVCARVRVVFYHPMPKTGGFILASNHVSHFDPPIIASFLPRKIDWIAMSDLFHGWFFHGIFTSLNVIPVDRTGGDRTALRKAVKRLRAGRVVGIFPEGGIRDGAASIVNGAEMKEGVSVLCAMSGAAVIPCVILGSDRLYHRRNWLPWRRAPVWIGCGAPIEPPHGLSGEEKRRHLTKALAEAIAGLRDRLRADFRLQEADLPHSPQERMREP